MEVFIKSNNCLELINNNKIFANFCVQNIKLIRSLILLYKKKSFTVNLFKTLKYFFIILTKIKHQHHTKMD